MTLSQNFMRKIKVHNFYRLNAKRSRNTKQKYDVKMIGHQRQSSLSFLLLSLFHCA